MICPRKIFILSKKSSVLNAKHFSFMIIFIIFCKKKQIANVDESEQEELLFCKRIVASWLSLFS